MQEEDSATSFRIEGQATLWGRAEFGLRKDLPDLVLVHTTPHPRHRATSLCSTAAGSYTY